MAGDEKVVQEAVRDVAGRLHVAVHEPAMADAIRVPAHCRPLVVVPAAHFDATLQRVNLRVRVHAAAVAAPAPGVPCAATGRYGWKVGGWVSGWWFFFVWLVVCEGVVLRRVQFFFVCVCVCGAAGVMVRAGMNVGALWAGK